MKNLLILLSFVLCAHLAAEPSPKSPETQVCIQHYTFSTIYEFQSENGLQGTAQRSYLRMTRYYDLFDAKGEPEGVANCRLQPGTIEIDVLDSEGVKIGFIAGKIHTPVLAQFDLYNAESVHIANAFMDWGSISITDAETDHLMLARFMVHLMPRQDAYGTLRQFAPEAIDARIVKALVSFAVDTNGQFKVAK